MWLISGRGWKECKECVSRENRAASPCGRIRVKRQPGDPFTLDPDSPLPTITVTMHLSSIYQVEHVLETRLKGVQNHIPKLP
uniref:Uncharacterized protein n=1 Tax=Chromera velia CCMP2878 TaxID=1169474 RepID=A0A0G4G936_9ALVE|eukprot:Cvel_585.t1-p1 / transcript=Cvel_585.t1 / gene=Cvel_585 / organism=Chromera_velia_CCMP2878 / gene_product=hypothetical protein / transcript_product=hypothetical protein / location=Cvel_scaffold18:61685-67441(-) / protein_length=81 / sequence_SO=supercontig / SO=protein_coding / is_pseudo=false